MSEDRTRCRRFDAWLLDDGVELERTEWPAHLAMCADCSAQWRAHVMLTETFANEQVPLPSPALENELDRKLASALHLRPLRGWRRVAMLGYAAAAAGGIGWLLKDVRLPAIDLSEPWVAVASLIAVPLSFLLAIGASRWMPAGGPARRYLPR